MVAFVKQMDIGRVAHAETSKNEDISIVLLKIFLKLEEILAEVI